MLIISREGSKSSAKILGGLLNKLDIAQFAPQESRRDCEKCTDVEPAERSVR